uniref:Uncharacterized protein n=1 Tax=Octopus bimaculoides TaxID=37653 RepID=A0A0L8HRF7_OCTBM
MSFLFLPQSFLLLLNFLLTHFFFCYCASLIHTSTSSLSLFYFIFLWFFYIFIFSFYICFSLKKNIFFISKLFNFVHRIFVFSFLFLFIYFFLYYLKKW